MVFGLPRWIPRIVWTLIALTLGLSLVAAIAAQHDHPWYAALALTPAKVWRGELWRLVTWPFVEPGPYGLLFACVALYRFGGPVAQAWGDRRFIGFVVGVLGVAGLGTAALALLVPGARHLSYLGGWALGDALIIAWALQFPDRSLRIYGVLVVGGRLLAYLTLGVPVLVACYVGPAWVLPEMIAGVSALVYMTGGPGRIWLRVTRWRPPLHVMRGGRDGGPYN